MEFPLPRVDLVLVECLLRTTSAKYCQKCKKRDWWTPPGVTHFEISFPKYFLLSLHVAKFPFRRKTTCPTSQDLQNKIAECNAKIEFRSDVLPHYIIHPTRTIVRAKIISVRRAETREDPLDRSFFTGSK
eukprot:Gregarina_sp_Poly_1__99@NODE_1021_length_5328_cov_19_525375_g712_i0_p2_GENE_NODE_1021_length_5328_cov_19_525375_g712_i0NODE_1021_length_5328_cov_19_525375_g712_i0_p2_ORF_typecomplete_len130_score9_07_NODE_1021_length_5328_cov_19_525375_g712_i045544943